MFTDNLSNLFNTQQLNIRTVSHLNNVYFNKVQKKWNDWNGVINDVSKSLKNFK